MMNKNFDAKVKIELKTLNEQLRKIKSMVKSIAAMPVSAAIQIDRFNDTVRLSLTNDNEFGYILLPDDKVQIVKLDQPIHLNAKLFFNTVSRFSKMKPEDLTIILNEPKIKLSNGKNQITTPVLTDLHFEEVDDQKSDCAKITLSGEQMQVVNQMIKTVHVDSNRQILTNLNFAIIERDQTKCLQLAATDSHVLVMAEQHYQGDIPVGFSQHVSFQALKDLAPLLTDDLVTFEFNKKDDGDVCTIIAGEDYRIQVAHILGNFPDIDRLWAKSVDYRTQIDRNQLATTLLNSMIVKNSDQNDANNDVVGFELNIDEQMIGIDAQTQIATYHDDLPIKQVLEVNRKEDYTIYFNKHFMIDILKIIDNENVLMNFSGPLRPIQIQSEKDVAGMQIKALVTPMRKF